MSQWPNVLLGLKISPGAPPGNLIAGSLVFSPSNQAIRRKVQRGVSGNTGILKTATGCN
jgi:hypothetical protein